MSATQLIVPAVEVGMLSDPGRDPSKQINEDSCRCGATPFGQLAVLCDGMGGHEGGREASMLAVESVFRQVSAAAIRADIPPAARAREVLRDAIAVANREVHAMGAVRDDNRPGSTIVAALMHPLGTEVAHVGDSRCYLVHDDQIRQVTRDHSMVQQMVDAGRLRPEEAAAHPDANKITRALGMATKIDVEVQRSSIVHVAGDALVLCSDGLSDLVAADEIRRVVTSAPAQAAADQLIALANERGGHDNITVIILRARESAATSPDAASDPFAFRMTESMAAVSPPSGAPGSAPSSASPTLAMAGDRPLVPPAPPPVRGAPRRPPPPAVVVGVVLGLIGLVAVVVVVALLVSPPAARTDVPGLSLSITLPAASLEPGAPAPGESDAAAAGADGGSRQKRFRSHPHR